MISSQKGTILTEFVVILPVIFIILFGLFTLNESLENQTTMQIAVNNFNHSRTIDQNTKANISRSKIGLQHIKGNIEFTDKNLQPLFPIRKSPQNGVKIPKVNAVKKKISTIYNTLDSFETALGNVALSQSTLGEKLADAGMLFNSKEGLERYIIQFKPNAELATLGKEVTSFNNNYYDDAPKNENFNMLTMPVITEAIIATESGYHPGPDVSNETFMGPLIGLVHPSSTHWGIRAGKFWEDEKSIVPKKEYKDDDKLKDGFTLNCPYNMNVSSDCVEANTEYTTVLTQLVMAKVTFDVVAAIGSAGGSTAQSTAIKFAANAAVNKTVHYVVDYVTKKVTESVGGQINEQVGNLMEALTTDIFDPIQNQVEGKEVGQIKDIYNIENLSGSKP